MRNFWLEADVDGRDTLVKGGPRCKDGGMGVMLYVRDEGCSVKALSVNCYEDSGYLNVEVFDDKGYKVYAKTTKR